MNAENADNGAVTLGTITQASSLTVNSGGEVTQTAAATVTGAVEVNAAGQNVSLTQADNTFGSVGVTGANVEIVEADATTLRATTATGTLKVTSEGALTQNGAVSATGTSTLKATAVTLGNDQNDFGGDVTIDGQVAGATIHDANALTVTAVDSTAGVDLQVGGDLTASGDVTGTTVAMTAGGALQTQAVTANAGNATLTGASVTTAGAVNATGK